MKIILAFGQNNSVENLLNQDGYFIASGFMENKLNFIREKIKSSRFKIVKEKDLEGWITLLLRKE